MIFSFSTCGQGLFPLYYMKNGLIPRGWYPGGRRSACPGRFTEYYTTFPQKPQASGLKGRVRKGEFMTKFWPPAWALILGCRLGRRREIATGDCRPLRTPPPLKRARAAGYLAQPSRAAVTSRPNRQVRKRNFYYLLAGTPLLTSSLWTRPAVPGSPYRTNQRPRRKEIGHGKMAYCL